MKFNTIIIPVMAVCVFAAAVQAACDNPITVIPRIGGGSTVGYPMIMPEIFFDGQSIQVWDEEGLPFPTLDWNVAPVLRALECPYVFDPAQPWAVLIGKPYNYQYGWDAAYLDEYTYPFPAGSAIWIKVMEQTPELETYYRDAGYAPIFLINDSNEIPSPDIWKWDKGMRHNSYAMPGDFYGRVSARYRLYLGDAFTGAELVDPNEGLPLYGRAEVTQRWVRPCPYALDGDINVDCVVNLDDMSLLSAQWITACGSPGWCDNADIDRTGMVDAADLLALAANWLVDCTQVPLNGACILQ